MPRDSNTTGKECSHNGDEEKGMTTAVLRCKVLRKRAAHHCGDSDHQTFIPQFSTFREEVIISATKCQAMYHQEVWKDHWHHETPIARRKMTVIRKEQVGSTDPYGGGDTQCIKAVYRQKGINIPDITLWEKLSITLDTDKLLFDTAGARIVNNHQIKI
jgi:hypothetical protein